MGVSDTTEKDWKEHYKEEMLKAEITDNLYEKTRNAIMESWNSAVVGLGQKRRGQLNAMFTILLDNIECIFKY